MPIEPVFIDAVDPRFDVRGAQEFRILQAGDIAADTVLEHIGPARYAARYAASLLPSLAPVRDGPKRGIRSHRNAVFRQNAEIILP